MREGTDGRTRRWSTVIAIALLLSGCATAWQDSGTFSRSAHTRLAVESLPVTARVYLDDRYRGDTPLSIALDCEQQVRRRTRKVSYWVTQPAWSFALTVTSLGLYLPFSLIPVDTETSSQPTDVFLRNEFIARVEAEGHNAWSANVTCGQRPTVSLRAVLEAAVNQ